MNPILNDYVEAAITVVLSCWTTTTVAGVRPQEGGGGGKIHEPVIMKTKNIKPVCTIDTLAQQASASGIFSLTRYLVEHRVLVANEHFDFFNFFS